MHAHDVVGASLAAAVLVLAGRVLLPSTAALAPALQRDRAHVLVCGVALLTRCPKGHDWPAWTGPSRHWIRALLGAAVIIGAVWSSADPVSQISAYDWVRRFLLGAIQGAGVAVVVHAVLWQVRRSRRDCR
ncbi:hypothetical protein ACFWNN_29730 [Lentzea sp. NPDC058450]|uniref:hypothetical protein n=1 Tax=Lentzea sp. NPDC058450 TaxID=3346505 RepID=UPI00364F22AA